MFLRPRFSALQLLAIGGGSKAELRLERPREVGLIAEADRGRDIGKFRFSIAQQIGGTAHAAFADVVADRLAARHAEGPCQMARADAAMSGEICKAKVTRGIGFKFVQRNGKPWFAAGALVQHFFFKTDVLRRMLAFRQA